jgi:hypothetical protein
MNALIVAILSKPILLKAETDIPICLPGVADDGFLRLAIKYITPNIGIIFAILGKEDCGECLAKANDIAKIIEGRGLVAEITKEIKSNYLSRGPVAPTGIILIL